MLPIRKHHLPLLMPMLLAASCATDRHAAAIQQTAVGGGFVAVGATVAVGGLVSTGLSAFSLASVQGVAPQDAVLAIGIPATGTIVASGLLVGLGSFLMNSVEADLADVSPAARAVVAQPIQQPVPGYSTEEGLVAGPTSPVSPSVPQASPAGLNWRALSSEMSAARRPDGAILLTFSTMALPKGCVFFTLTGSGASVRVDPAPDWQNTIVITSDAKIDGSTGLLLEGCGITQPISRDLVFNISRIRAGF